MKKFTSYALVSAAVLTMLAACGGGGGDAPVAAPVPASTADATDKYVGSWGLCTPVTNATNGVVSSRATFVFTKNSATSLSLKVNGTGFSAANCTGAVLNSLVDVVKGTYTLNGTKIIGNDTVDLINLTSTSATIPSFNGSFKDIALVTGTTLYTGASSAADAQGYPTVISRLNVFNKL